MLNLTASPQEGKTVDISLLKTEGYVTIRYPDSLRHCVLDAMASWQRFCQLPIEDKVRLSSETDRTQDFGYMRRKDNGPRSESKELFHLKRANLPVMRPMADAITDPRAVAYIDAVDSLISAIKPTVERFARSAELEFDLSNFTRDVIEFSDMWTFRFIHYFGGEMLALPHVDRGGFTLHLAEDKSGGEHLDRASTWHPWPVNAAQTVIFPGMKLEHRSNGLLKALWHQVSPTETTRQQGRFAMVAFIDFDWTHRIDTQRHRMQDLPPGFNYTAPFEEFNKLFIPC